MRTRACPTGSATATATGASSWETTLDIEPLAYIRTEDGFVTSMHDLVVQGASMRYHVPFFNPGSNQAQVSQLRLINTSDTENEVTIVGLDDDGQPGEDNVRFTLPGNGARTVSAQELEDGGSDLPGGLGDGKGKWHLFVSAEHPVHLLNMLRSPTGNLTNLSTSTSDRDFAPPGFAPADQAAFDRQMVGKQLDAGDFVLDFVSDGRFDETGSGGSHEVSGSYSYTRVDPDTGTLNLTYDSSGFAGGSCTVQLTYASSSTGTWSYTCVSGAQNQGTWRTAQTSGPDLVVQSASVTDSTPDAGASFTLSATVRNQGSARSAATTLRYYRSSDATISTSDTAVGTDAVSALAASGTEAESIRLTAPRSADTYYYGACVDAVSRESNSRNNCSTGVRITVSGGGSTVCDSSAGEVDIPDAALRKAVEDHLEMAPGATITPGDMRSLVSLETNQLGIERLTGLQCATALERLYLSSNEISDLEPLAGLTALEVLALGNNRISDVGPLAGLTALAELYLHNNEISDSDLAPLAGLTALEMLSLAENPISDLTPLAGLTGLHWLSVHHLFGVHHNRISDLTPLAGLTGLRYLLLYRNEISDLTPLAGLTALEELYLGANRISDLEPLAGLTALGVLGLERNPISDSDLAPLADLTALWSLSLGRNRISDIGPLAGLTALQYLDLHDNQISDIGPLAGLAALVGLYLGGNQIADIAPLVANAGLGRGDIVGMFPNPLSTESMDVHVPALRARGVRVIETVHVNHTISIRSSTRIGAIWKAQSATSEPLRE